MAAVSMVGYRIVPPCHPERSEGAETRLSLLRFAQDDNKGFVSQ